MMLDSRRQANYEAAEVRTLLCDVCGEGFVPSMIASDLHCTVSVLPYFSFLSLNAAAYSGIAVVKVRPCP